MEGTYVLVTDGPCEVSKQVPVVDGGIGFLTLERDFPKFYDLEYKALNDNKRYRLVATEDCFLEPPDGWEGKEFFIVRKPGSVRLEHKPVRLTSSMNAEPSHCPAVCGKSEPVVACVTKDIKFLKTETPFFITAIDDLNGIQRTIDVVDNCIFLNTFNEKFGAQNRLEYEFKDGDMKGARCILDVDLARTKYLCPPLGWVGKTYYIVPKSVRLSSSMNAKPRHHPAVHDKSEPVVDHVSNDNKFLKTETPSFIIAVVGLTGVKLKIPVVDDCIWIRDFEYNFGTKNRLEYEYTEGDEKGKRGIFRLDPTGTKLTRPFSGWLGKSYHIVPKFVRSSATFKKFAS